MASYTKDDSQPETTSYSRYNHNKSAKDKGEMECYYCKKMGHTTWKCVFWVYEVLTRKLKGKPHVASVAIFEDLLNVDNGDELTE